MSINLGQKLKELRTEREWTQAELSKRTGLDRGYLAYIESGRVGKPSADTFLKLARAFNIRPEELYQAAGYIKEASTAYRYKESAEDILERLRLAQPVGIPVYSEFPVHAGGLMEPIEYIYRTRPGVAKKSVEGYLIRGKCLEPVIRDMDIIIVDREAEINSGDVVAGLVGDSMILGKLKRIDDELWLENNEGRIKFEDCQVVAVVIEVIRRLK